MSNMKHTDYARSVIAEQVPDGFRPIPSLQSYAINKDGSSFICLVRWLDKGVSRGDFPASSIPISDDFRSHYNLHPHEDGPRHGTQHPLGTGYSQYCATLCPLDDGFQRLAFPDHPSLPEWATAQGYTGDASYMHRDEYMKAKRRVSKRNERRRLIHRLVFEAWSGEPLKKGFHIDHIDGNKQNNDISNLRQVSPFENTHNPNTFQKHVAAISKLTEDEVHAIRRAWDSRPTYVKAKALKQKLAADYSVSAANIEAIAHRKSWRHLPEEDGSEMRTPKRRVSKLTDDQVCSIKHTLENKHPCITQKELSAELAVSFGVSVSTIISIGSGRTHKHVTQEAHK